MKLSKILQNVLVTKIIGDENCEIVDVVCDTNLVNKGTLFICLNGDVYDGHNFVAQAEQYGAIAIVCERELDCSLTQIVVENSRIAMSCIAQNFYGNPAEKLKLIGVTGTNGKTTTSQMIHQILNYAGINCGVIGTLGAYYLGNSIESKLTTPDPLELNYIFSEMVKEGVEVVVMEISAHASFYDKIYGLKFEIGVFTNFTQDHMDFFGTMENYAEAKLKFLLENDVKYIVANADDDFTLSRIPKTEKVITYGIENPADVFAINFSRKENFTSFVVNLFDCIENVKLKLHGLYNVYNSLAALTCCSLIGLKPNRAVSGLELIENIPGRLEKVYDKKFEIFIDYAHTPDGLEKTLFTLKTICKNRLICLFGCGGNRDTLKRKIMGEISGSLADFTIVTTDNPRYEEPMEIISQIEEGVYKKTSKYIIVQERESAIEYAINMAEEGDVLLVAGKGREKYQEVLGIKKPYDDYSIIKEILQRKSL